MAYNSPAILRFGFRPLQITADLFWLKTYGLTVWGECIWEFLLKLLFSAGLWVVCLGRTHFLFVCVCLVTFRFRACQPLWTTTSREGHNVVRSFGWSGPKSNYVLGCDHLYASTAISVLASALRMSFCAKRRRLLDGEATWWWSGWANRPRPIHKSDDGKEIGSSWLRQLFCHA